MYLGILSQGVLCREKGWGGGAGDSQIMWKMRKTTFFKNISELLRTFNVYYKFTRYISRSYLTTEGIFLVFEETVFLGTHFRKPFSLKQKLVKCLVFERIQFNPVEFKLE